MRIRSKISNTYRQNYGAELILIVTYLMLNKVVEPS